MTATLEMTVPTGWRLVTRGDGPHSVETVANDLVQDVPSSDRSARLREVRGALEAGFASVAAEDAEVASLLVPGGVAGARLPITVAVLRLTMATRSSMEANRALAGIAAQDPTARLLATDAGPAMRTHSLAPFGRLHAERLGLDERDLADGAALHARYLLPPRGKGRWLALVHTVLMVEPDSVSAWLELCDALVTAVQWRRDE
ncbi:hypothetical protein RN607_12140 [Demequina capsici]|uniref:Uncharacterized protein n=1 Tax=Demequina capsici TaxID=3075620 RepID=A0AA96FCH2_9MICO|nr:hypothetical protein [Demequina sp. PMTSA13]WNM26942.1 hypothetical protein RN607_12140 [Demequina sp. PMTSA13]